MKSKIIEKVICITLSAAIICMVCVGFFHHFAKGVSIFVGTVWGSLNLFFLKNFIENLLLKKSKNINIFLLGCIKWPVLYLAGYALLKTNYLSPIFFLLGFSLVFLTIFIFGCIGAIKSYGK